MFPLTARGNFGHHLSTFMLSLRVGQWTRLKAGFDTGHRGTVQSVMSGGRNQGEGVSAPSEGTDGFFNVA